MAAYCEGVMLSMVLMPAPLGLVSTVLKFTPRRSVTRPEKSGIMPNTPIEPVMVVRSAKIESAPQLM